jgi:hypothetical protein
MANVGPSRSKPGPWRWAAAVVFSLLVNSFVVAVFWELRLAPVYDSALPIVVHIIPRLTLPRFSSAAVKHPHARPAPRAFRPSSALAPAPSAPASVAASAPTVAPPNGADVANLSGALRGIFGCSLPHLTDAERAACGGRLAANRPTISTALNLDPHGRYVSNPEPYLNRMPKNGCKVRAAGDATPFGGEGVAAGVSCGWSF